MSLNLEKFILVLSKNALKKYLNAKLTDIQDKIDFLKITDNEAYSIAFFDFIDTLTQEQFNILYSDFDIVDFLTQNNIGTDAIQAALSNFKQDKLLEDFHKSNNHKDFTLNLLLKHQDIIDFAFILYHENKFTTSHSKWNMFYITPDQKGFDVFLTDNALDNFNNEIIKIYKQKNKLAQIFIKWIPRLQGNKIVQYAMIYKQGNPKSYQTLDKTNKLKPITIREAIESSLKYDAEKGIVHIMGEGGQRQHEKIAMSFRTHLTDCSNNDALTIIAKKNINFKLFSNPPQFEIPPNSNIKSIQVELIKLSNDVCITEKPRKLRTTFECSTTVNDKADILYDLIQEEHPSTYDNRNDWDIKKIKLRIHFEKEDKGRHKSINFDLMYPNTHNLKALTANHEYILEQLLDKLGIFDNETD